MGAMVICRAAGWDAAMFVGVVGGGVGVAAGGTVVALVGACDSGAAVGSD